MRVIQTGRLTLEPQMAAHAEAMFLVLSDPAIYAYENAPPASLEWLRQRFTKLESRESLDGTEQWLNWVIRLPSGELIGYVQATVGAHETGAAATIAYELSSPHWGQGFASEAVLAMVEELVARYQVVGLSAVLKQQNRRSLRLLERLGFALASPLQHEQAGVEADELLMLRAGQYIAPMKSRNLTAIAGVAVVVVAAAALLGCAAPSSPSADPSTSAPPGLGDDIASAIEVCKPPGERAYLDRLQCLDGSTPAYRRVGSFGTRSKLPNDGGPKLQAEVLDQLLRSTPLKPGEPDYHIIDGYELSCGPVKRMVYMDMYHCTQTAPTEAPRGFRLRSPA